MLETILLSWYEEYFWLYKDKYPNSIAYHKL